MAARKINKKEKKSEILEAALKVFADKGIHRTKMADISKEAGFSYGIVYQYFKNQEELLIESYMYLYQKFFDEFQNQFISSESAKKTLKNFIRAISDSLVNMDHKTVMLFTDFWVEGLRGHERYNTFIKDAFLEFRTMLQELLKQGIENEEFIKHDTEKIALMIMALVDGNKLYHLMVPQFLSLKDQLFYTLELILNSIRKEK